MYTGIVAIADEAAFIVSEYSEFVGLRSTADTTARPIDCDATVGHCAQSEEFAPLCRTRPVARAVRPLNWARCTCYTHKAANSLVK